MTFVYLEFSGNIPNCSSSIRHIAVGIAIVFRPNNDSERNPTPDAPVGCSSSGASFPSPRIQRSISSEPPLHAEESQESQSEIPVQASTLNLDASSETHPPAGFRSNVTTPAAIEASKSRRKSASKYFCKYCRQGFTRKSNLDREPSNFGSYFYAEACTEHYRSHLGVPTKLCPFCRQMFMSSISRHKKSCKQNPNRHGANRQLEANPEPSTQ